MGGGGSDGWVEDLPSASGPADPNKIRDDEPPTNQFVLFLRECLLLLAVQVVTVTYAAGLNPPGGVWPETKDGHLTGNPILAHTDHVRYNAFSCSNATALMASAAVVLLLLFVRNKKSSERPWFNTVLRTVMSLAILALAVAYATGASRNKFTIKFASVLVGLLFVCVVIFTAVWIGAIKQDFSADIDALNSRAMFGAIFLMSMAYTAGLSPPGGFWLDTQEAAGHRAGDPALSFHNRRRFTAFFVGNTMAFVAPLLIVPLLLTNDNKIFMCCCGNYLTNLAQTGLVIAYASGSSMETSYIAYVLLSGYAILPAMALVAMIQGCWQSVKDWLKHWVLRTSSYDDDDGLEAFFMVLFTTFSAAVTYQAGLNPPGGLWLDDLDGHKAGDPILLAKHPVRYRTFIYCNSMALVASLVATFMALTERCQGKRSRALDGLMVLDLVGLIGAYAAGCCRDAQTSVHVISLGGAVVVYVVLHMAFLMRRSKLGELIKDDKEVRLDRDLILGILGAMLTYQNGLAPPGGFWPSDDAFGHHAAGDPVLLSTYPHRYKLFLYLNAICFMASIFLTILFLNPLLYRAGLRSRALFICVLAVLLGLMGAYAAGSYRNLGPSIYIITLGAAVLILVISIILYLLLQNSKHQQDEESTDNKKQQQKQQQQEEEEEGESTDKKQEQQQEEEQKQQQQQQEQRQAAAAGQPKDKESSDDDDKKEKMLMYLVIIGSIGTTVTYLAGFAPPMGFWSADDSNNGHAVGYPVLRDIDARRYRIFFFGNTTSFAASSLIMNGGWMMQFVDWLVSDDDRATKPMTIYRVLQAPTAVYVIGILTAYAAGCSTSGWTNTTIYAVALVAPVLFCIVLLDRVITWARKRASAIVL